MISMRFFALALGLDELDAACLRSKYCNEIPIALWLSTAQFQIRSEVLAIYLLSRRSGLSSKYIPFSNASVLCCTPAVRIAEWSWGLYAFAFFR